MNESTCPKALTMDWLLALDFDVRVRDFLVKPFTLRYQHEGSRRRYTPYVRADYEDAGEIASVVYEVKPRQELRDSWETYRPRFRAAMRYCRDHGWRFKVVTEREIRTALLENAKFLRRYRLLSEQTDCVLQLLYTLRALGKTTPQALLAAAYWSDESKMAALPMLWKLLATRRIAADLQTRLTMSAAIWPLGDER